MNITMRNLTSPRTPSWGKSRAKRRPSSQHLSREARKLIARIRRHPADEPSLGRLREIYTAQADYNSLANLLEGWAQRSATPESAGELFCAAAEAVLEAGGNRARAAYLLERSLQRQPMRAERLDRLSTLLAQMGELEALKHALQRLLLRLQKDSDADTRWVATVEYRLGRLYQSHFGEDEKALQHYRLALEYNPNYLPAIQGAQYLYRQQGNQRAVALLWELEIRATPDPQVQVELLLALATHQDRHLGDLNGAILSLRRALRLAPNQTLTKVRLARLLLSRFHERGDVLDKTRAAAVFLQLANQTTGARAVAYAEHCHELDPFSRAAQARLESAREEERAEKEAVAKQVIEAALLHGESSARAQAPAQAGEAETCGIETRPAMGPVGDAREARTSAADVEADTSTTVASAAPSATDHAQLAQAQATQLRKTQEQRDVDAWLHHDELSPLAENTGHLEPIEADYGTPPPAEHICRICNALPASEGHTPMEVNLGVTMGSHLYVTVDGTLRSGGIFALTYQQLPLNTPVAIKVTFPGGDETRALGRVRFLRDTWDCDEDQEPGMAIEFEALTQSGLELMELYASQRAPILYDN